MIPKINTHIPTRLAYPRFKKVKVKKVEVAYRGQLVEFNKFRLGLFISHFEMKGNLHDSHDRSMKDDSAPSSIYFQQAVDLIVESLERDLQGCLDKLSEKKKP